MKKNSKGSNTKNQANSVPPDLQMISKIQVKNITYNILTAKILAMFLTLHFIAPKQYILREPIFWYIKITIAITEMLRYTIAGLHKDIWFILLIRDYILGTFSL